jgi:hypothetical protein
MYDVAVVIEQQLSSVDADQIVSLHEGLDEPVAYHVLLPVEDAAARIEASLGSLAANQALAPPAAVLPGGEVDLSRVQQEVLEHSRQALQSSVDQLAARGRAADGAVTMEEPVAALTSLVQKCGAREALILTRPHVVAEFFHVDWASRARRHLGVPLLHLLEHETFAEQSGGGEGINVI